MSNASTASADTKGGGPKHRKKLSSVLEFQRKWDSKNQNPNPLEYPSSVFDLKDVPEDSGESQRSTGSVAGDSSESRHDLAGTADPEGFVPTVDPVQEGVESPAAESPVPAVVFPDGTQGALAVHQTTAGDGHGLAVHQTTAGNDGQHNRRRRNTVESLHSLPRGETTDDEERLEMMPPAEFSRSSVPVPIDRTSSGKAASNTERDGAPTSQIHF